MERINLVPIQESGLAFPCVGLDPGRGTVAIDLHLHRYEPSVYPYPPSPYEPIYACEVRAFDRGAESVLWWMEDER